MSPVRCPSCREPLDASDSDLLMGGRWHRPCVIATISIHAQSTEFRGALRPMTCPRCLDLVKTTPRFVDDLGHPWHPACVSRFLAQVVPDTEHHQ